MDIEDVTISAAYINELVIETASAVKDGIETKNLTGIVSNLNIFSHDIYDKKHMKHIVLPPATTIEKDLMVVAQIGKDIAHLLLKVDIVVLVTLGRTTVKDMEDVDLFGVIVSAHSACNKSSSAIMEIENFAEGSPMKFTGNNILDKYDPNNPKSSTDVLGLFHSFYIAHFTELTRVLRKWRHVHRQMVDPCMN